jgi:hypothetical protein
LPEGGCVPAHYTGGDKKRRAKNERDPHEAAYLAGIHIHTFNVQHSAKKRYSLHTSPLRRVSRIAFKVNRALDRRERAIVFTCRLCFRRLNEAY